MNKVDREYCDLLREILDYGRYKQTRAGETISLFGKSMRFNLQDGIPLLTTKKVFTKGIIHELLWFLEKTDKKTMNIKYLVDNNVHIWTDDAYRWYCEKCKQNNEECNDKNIFIKYVKLNATHTFKNGEEYKYGDLGPIYGIQWRGFGIKGVDQIQNIIDTLKNDPDNRRLLCVAYNPDVLDDVALPPCHVMFQFYTQELQSIERLAWLQEHSNGEYDEWKYATHKKLDELNVPRRILSCCFTMRSNDFCCGNPYNICQYAMLTYMLCEVCNMIPGELVYNGGDVHVYTNHIEGAKEQLSRNGSEVIPKLKFNRKVTDINDFRYEDFLIEDYYPEPSIKYELNVGL